MHENVSEMWWCNNSPTETELKDLDVKLHEWMSLSENQISNCIQVTMANYLQNQFLT
jgi:hypothetical protein